MVAEIISGLIQGLYAIIDSIINSGRAKETVKEHIVKNEFIHQRLVNLLHDIEADRLSIRQYHNGGYYYSGLPLQKYSCTYEVVTEGISAELPNNQNKLVSETPTLHSAIIREKEYIIENVDNVTDITFKQKLQNRGVKSFYAQGIWDLQDNLIGLLCVDYVIDEHTITEDERIELDNFTKLVSGYLVASPSKQPKSLVVTVMIFSIALTILLSQIAFLISSIYNLLKFWL